MKHPKVVFGLPPAGHGPFSFDLSREPRTIPPPPSYDVFGLHPSESALLGTSSIPPHKIFSPFTISNETFYKYLNWKFPIVVAVVYLIVVKSWNAVNRSRGGKPWAIAKTRSFFWLVVAHNVFLAAYSAWTFIGITRAAYNSFVVSPWSAAEAAATGPAGSASASLGAQLSAIVDSLSHIHGEKGYGKATFFNTTLASWVGPTFANGQAGAANSQMSLGTVKVPNSMVPGRLWNEGLAFYGWWFYLSKAYEVVDTLIILLKGKQSSTLQSYHHAGALICMWTGIRYMSPPIFMFCFLNSAIHTLMYTYYTITSFSIPVPKALKRTLTTMQITQFLVGGGSAASFLFLFYSYPVTTIATDPSANGYRIVTEYELVPALSTPGQALAVWLNVAYLTPLTYLFVRFFVKSYLRSSNRAPQRSAAGARVQNAGAAAAKEVTRQTEVGATVVQKPVNGNAPSTGHAIAHDADDVVTTLKETITSAQSSARQAAKEAGVKGRKTFERTKKLAD